MNEAYTDIHSRTFQVTYKEKQSKKNENKNKLR